MGEGMNDSPTEIRMKMAKLREHYTEYSPFYQATVWQDLNAVQKHNELQTLLEAMEND
jgi:hypothetical protein